MNTKDALSKLADDPEDREARRVIARIASQRVAGQLLAIDLDERPNLVDIASEILSDHGPAFPTTVKSRLAVTVTAIVESVLNDDEPSRVTELFKDWQANGRVGGDSMYDALQVSLAKRMRWALRKFDSVQHKISPGDLFNDLFMRLQQCGLPDTLQNRKEFYLYCDTVLQNLLLDRIRADGRQKRAVAEVHLDDLIDVIQNGGDGGAPIRLTPQASIDVRRAMELLPEDLQDVIRHRYLWGVSQKELVEQWGISRAALDRQQRKALTALRDVLTAGGYSPLGK